MRAVLHQDLTALARAMVLVPSGTRTRFARRIILMADAADRHRRSTGRAHPAFGDGTLSGALLRQPKGADTRLDDIRYSECLMDALSEIVRFRAAYPAVQLTQRGTAGS